MKRILCPTDFTETAHHGIAYAAKFAQVTESELNLFHVHSRFDLTPREIIRGQEMTQQALEEQLENQSLEISQQFKISCTADVALTARPLPFTITERAAKKDLIIMGTNGVDEYIEFFTGSNTYRIIRKSSIPLLLVPKEADFSPIKKIIYAFDLLHTQNYHLHQLMFWAKALHCEVCAVQVVKEQYTHELELKIKQAQNELKDFFDSDIALEFDILWSEDIAGSIHSYMLRTGSDMLALCSHHYHFAEKLFHKSVIKVISSIAHYPVFVFHE